MLSNQSFVWFFCYRKVPTNQYKDDLLPYFERGMNNYRTTQAKDLLKEAVKKTGLTKEEIKVTFFYFDVCTSLYYIGTSKSRLPVNTAK